MMERLKSFADYVGNVSAKKVLQEAIKAHTIECKVLPHILIYGPAGAGKTTIANIIASETDYEFIVTIGSALRFQVDVIKLLHTINDNRNRGRRTILFIDEIHNLDKNSLPETSWYPVLEDGIFYSNLEGATIKIDGIPYNVNSNTFRLEDDALCVIGATTDPGMLTAPLRRRFPIQVFMEGYSVDDITRIVKEYAERKHGLSVVSDGCKYIANRSRLNPSNAISLTEAVIRRCIVEKNMTIQCLRDIVIPMSIIKPTLTDLGVMEYGIRKEDLMVMEILNNYPNGIGRVNLSKSCGFSMNFYSELIEPYLKQMGFVVTTTRTFITEKGTALLQNINKSP